MNKLAQLQVQLGALVMAEVRQCLNAVPIRAHQRVGHLGQGRPAEPDYVAQMVFDLPRMINTRLAAHFPPHTRIAAKAVFVHQSPKVRCATFPSPLPQSVEIGDLLLAISHRHVGGQVDRWAMLLQAKVSRQYDPLLPDNQNQHHLYCLWPQFEYVTSPLAGQFRNVAGPGLYTGAKYLLIDPLPGHPRHNQWFGWRGIMLSAHPTQPRLSSVRRFDGQTFRTIFGNGGRAFMLNPPAHDGWDQVMTDLLTVTAQLVSRTLQGQPRGHGQLFFVDGLPRLLHDADGSLPLHVPIQHLVSEGQQIPPAPLGDGGIPADEGGISIIEIDVEDEEE